MNKKAIIFDLDNTLYAAESIGDELFSYLFTLIAAEGKHDHEMENIKKDILKKPFQQVAVKYNFSEKLSDTAIAHLKNLTFTGIMEVFKDYKYLKNLPVEKYLVTSGFVKLQLSKIKCLGIANDFKEIHIVDVTTKQQTKKNVFTDIMLRYNYHVDEVLIVGDDVDSEIKAAQQLGIDAVLYSKAVNKKMADGIKIIADFSELGFICKVK